MSKPVDGGFVSGNRGYKDADGNPLRWRGACKRIFEDLVIEDTDDHASASQGCYAADKMHVYISIESTGAPTSIELIAQFQCTACADIASTWHDYKIGAWAYLVYSAVEVESGINEVIDLSCVGDNFRLIARAVDASSGNSFTITAHVQPIKD